VLGRHGGVLIRHKGSPSPGKVWETKRVRGDHWLTVIRSVGKAANLLTDEHR
jgi:hypothetical protein